MLVAIGELCEILHANSEWREPCDAAARAGATPPFTKPKQARATGMAFERDGGSLSPAELAVNPRVLSRLLRALGERDLPAAGITGLIRCDPALTLQVLLAGASGAG